VAEEATTEDIVYFVALRKLEAKERKREDARAQATREREAIARAKRK